MIFRQDARTVRAVRYGRLRAAFTLLELLIVIGVVGIALLLLSVAVQNARRMAARADGAAVMRNLGQAMTLYINDHNGRLPGPLYWRQTVRYIGPNGNLIPLLAPYMGSPVRTDLPFPPACPAVWAKWVAADPTTTIYQINAETIEGYNQWMWGNANIDSWGRKPGSAPLLLLAAAPAPARRWAFQDIPLKDIFAVKPLPDALKADQKETIWGLYQQRLYFDGHIEGFVLH